MHIHSMRVIFPMKTRCILFWLITIYMCRHTHVRYTTYLPVMLIGACTIFYRKYVYTDITYDHYDVYLCFCLMEIMLHKI